VVSDVSALTTDNYQLDFDGANWTLTSDSGSSATVANGSPATLVFEGLTLTIDGATAVAGDRFTVKPTLAASGGLTVLTSDPGEIAAALPIRSGASLDNLGDVEISAGIVTDVTNPLLLNSATLTFDNPPATLRADVDVVVGGVPYLAGAAIPFSNNMAIDANGWQVSLNGAPQAGWPTCSMSAFSMAVLPPTRRITAAWWDLSARRPWPRTSNVTPRKPCYYRRSIDNPLKLRSIWTKKQLIWCVISRPTKRAPV
jgi:hypothetical protein